MTTLRSWLAVVALSVAVLATGCVTVGTPAVGSLYMDVKGPITATDSAASKKEGTGVCTSILGLIAYGDCSISTAAESADIHKIKSVDHKTMSILGIYATYTVVVKGE